jgi:NDP-sugar pyrophosphorylase family protein
MKGKHIFSIRGDKSQYSITVCINASQPINNRKNLGPRCLVKYKDKPVLEHQIDLIKRSFEFPEIIVITGFSTKTIYNNRPEGVKLVENQLYESTRDCEQIRLVSQVAQNDNIIFLPDNMMLSREDLQLLAKQSTVLTSDDMLSEKVVLFENEKLIDFVYYKNESSNFYANCYSLQGRELKLANNFSFNNPYSSYLDSETLSQVAKQGGDIFVKNSLSAEFVV